MIFDRDGRSHHASHRRAVLGTVKASSLRSDAASAALRTLTAPELGRWTFLAPLGYLNAHRTTGRSLIPDPERASLVRRAFQDFATGRFTKHEVRKKVNALGLTTRRGKPVPSQTFDAMLRNRAYIAQIDVADFGISKRGDFEPLITERIFFRVQGILDGRYEVTAPKQRNDPDFPLRAYVRCDACSTRSFTRRMKPAVGCSRPSSLTNSSSSFVLLMFTARHRPRQW